MFSAKNRKNEKNYSGRFPTGGPKRGNPTMTTSTVTARRREDPQHFVEAINLQWGFGIPVQLPVGLSPDLAAFWPCPAAPGRHFDLSCCSRATFRPVLLLRDDISTCPAASARHFGLSCCSRTTFRIVPDARDLVFLQDFLLIYKDFSK